MSKLFIIAGILLLSLVVSGTVFLYGRDPVDSQTERLAWLSADETDVVVKNSRVFFRRQPFTGILKRNGENGQMLSLAWYRDGFKQGPNFQWSSDGALASIRFYLEGRPEALNWGFWPSGSIKFLYQFKEGVLEGLSQDWYEDGTPYLRRNYSQGRELGQQQAWNEKGKMISNYVMKGEKRYGLVGSQPCFTVH